MGGFGKRNAGPSKGKKNNSKRPRLSVKDKAHLKEFGETHDFANFNDAVFEKCVSLF
eukprot:Pgem_evm1s15006